jgi:hypothetical protein
MYADILIRIRPQHKESGIYPVEATLDDGSHYENGMLHINQEELRSASAKPDYKSYGLALFDALFSGDIRLAYEKVTGRAESEAEGRVRVRLWIDKDAAELHALPWERLYHMHRVQKVALATSTLTPFSRYTSLPVAEGKQVTERPIRILVAIANPVNLPGGLVPIPVEEEVANLHQALGDLTRRKEVQVALLPGRTGLSSALRTKLEDGGYLIQDGVTSLDNIVRLLPEYHVLHFLGHGHFRREGQHGQGTAALHLERTDGNWIAVEDDDLVPMLTAAHLMPRLVFLAACESAKRATEAEHPFIGLGPKLVQAGVPAVIAMQDVVPMPLAQQLTADFYRNLLKHGIVDLALNQARLLLFEQEGCDWAIPVLFLRMETGQLFAPLQSDADPEWLKAYLQAREEAFITHMRGKEEVTAEHAAGYYVELLVRERKKLEESEQRTCPLSDFVKQPGTRYVLFGG